MNTDESGSSRYRKFRRRLADNSVEQFGWTAKRIRLENKLPRSQVEPVFKKYAQRYDNGQQDPVRFVIAVEHGHFSKVRYYWPEMVAEATNATPFQHYRLYAAAQLAIPRPKKEVECLYLLHWLWEQGGFMQKIMQYQQGKRKIKDLSDNDLNVLFHTIIDALRTESKVFDNE